MEKLTKKKPLRMHTGWLTLYASWGVLKGQRSNEAVKPKKKALGIAHPKKGERCLGPFFEEKKKRQFEEKKYFFITFIIFLDKAYFFGSTNDVHWRFLRIKIFIE